MKACGNEAGDVRDVRHQQGPNFMGDLGELGPFPFARVGACAGDDQLRLILQRGAADFGHVDALGLLVERVVNRFEPFARHVHGLAVGEVAAVIEVEPHNGIAGGESGEEDGLVGLGAGVGLDVDVFGLEEFLRAVARQVFDDVHELAAAIVALAGIAFGVFVGQRGCGRGEDGGGNMVFGGDELEGRFLAMGFVLNGLPERGIVLGDWVHPWVLRKRETRQRDSFKAGVNRPLYGERSSDKGAHDSGFLRGRASRGTRGG